jgi:hypothetical protein
MLFLNSCRASVIPYSVTTHPPAIQKQQWHSREAQIESPLIECEWAFRIRALDFGVENFENACDPDLLKIFVAILESRSN